MILEALSQELQAPENQGRTPERVMYDWLVGILLEPPAPTDHVGRVLHTEIQLIDAGVECMDMLTTEPGQFSFEGRSESGNRLLVSLFNFCRSFDNWQFSRWLHNVHASDFYVT